MTNTHGTKTVDKNDFFRQATLRISSSLNIETAMRRLIAYLQEYMPLSGMLFVLYDPSLNVARTLASILPDDLPKPEERITPYGKLRDFLIWDWRKEPEVRIINDVDQEGPQVRELLGTILPPDTSVLTMDLQLEGRRLSRLFLFAEGRRSYLPMHADLIALLHEPIAMAASNVLQHEEISRLKDLLAEENQYLHQEILKMTGDTIIGADFGLKDVMTMVRQVAPIDSPVLLMGETGVGKEVVANAIQLASQRRGKPFVKVNCGAIPDNLIDSELFGHEKGAFTGAVSRKKGYFERAHTGTIFLDEIGELPPAAQLRLLRVLQHHQFERVGGTEPISVDVRLISATHRNLDDLVNAQQFREDLWFRINVFPIIIPPLRQRIDDIPALVHYIMESKSKELKIRDIPRLAGDALDQLQAYHWPGNVRELENLVERALILSRRTDGDNVLRFNSLSTRQESGKTQSVVEKADTILPLDHVIVTHIRRALDSSAGRIEGESGAAKKLGLHPSTLRARMRKFGIPHGKKRG